MNPEQNKETGQEPNEQDKKPYIPAWQAADVYRSPTTAVDPHNTHQYASTGTNISYEGATAPGSGGATGTGEASGQPADGSRITTTRADETGEIGRHGDKVEGNDNVGTPPPPNTSGGDTNAGKAGETKEAE